MKSSVNAKHYEIMHPKTGGGTPKKLNSIEQDIIDFLRSQHSYKIEGIPGGLDTIVSCMCYEMYDFVFRTSSHGATQLISMDNMSDCDSQTTVTVINISEIDTGSETDFNLSDVYEVSISE